MKKLQMNAEAYWNQKWRQHVLQQTVGRRVTMKVTLLLPPITYRLNLNLNQLY